jgi:hypothetical protein
MSNRHKADTYFSEKFLRGQMGKEAFGIVSEAYRVRHRYPGLSGPELVRLVYWGASGSTEV